MNPFDESRRDFFIYLIPGFSRSGRSQYSVAVAVISGSFKAEWAVLNLDVQ